MMPDARLYSVRGDNPPAAIALDTRVKGIAASTSAAGWRSSGASTSSPRGGKFSHCGIDAVTLFKTAEGWKIASLAFTMETAGCKPA